MTRAALILAGGAGTRLWPLSSDENPKQFLRLFEGRSLLQRTWDRVARVLPPEQIFISTNARYREKCLEQLPALKAENIVAEPARRNNAPAIALSCFAIEAKLGDAAIALLPADHFITEEDEFLRVLDRCWSFAERNDYLVTIALTPDEPNTGYGYLELGEELEPGVIGLRRFVEKPDRARAEEFLRAGNYAWNGGIFIWRASVFRNALRETTPELLRTSEASYGDMPATSIDYALLEKAPRVATVRGDFGWSDVGSWAAVAKLAKSSPVHTAEAQNVFAISSKPVAVVGVSNVIVIESPDGVLVLQNDAADQFAALSKKLT
ncbi:MAG TPA: mannose-1-phosphate guanylyltransferase [Thermoanaerobaculia bacterium]|nr:mannose-1-phosphate guanylyltransferase [Thermoanaerobaculia bacterium]